MVPRQKCFLIENPASIVYSVLFVCTFFFGHPGFGGRKVFSTEEFCCIESEKENK
jgi:hypothetical protein